jgi:hypothetical protein
VLDEYELPTRLQNSHNFSERQLLVPDATEHKCADNCIDRTVWNRQVVRSSASQLDLHPKSRAFFLEILAHKMIGFYTDPLNAFSKKISKVRARARPNLEDSSREIGKQLSFVLLNKSLVFLIEMGKSPCERALAPSIRSGEASRGANFFLVHGPSPGIQLHCSLQFSDEARPIAGATGEYMRDERSQQVSKQPVCLS